MLRIGRIEYANCTPLFHALAALYPESGYRYLRGVPAHLNALLASGGIDVCPCSSITFATHADRYLIIPDVSISSRGPVLSVLLFSRLPIEELDNTTVLLSSESATSVNLLKILLGIRYGCRCDFQVTDQNDPATLRRGDAILLIGDAALRAGMSDHGLFVYDLGALWYDWTATPFVFALWLTTREVLARREEELWCLARQLSHAKGYAEEHLEDIVRVSPERHWMGEGMLGEYWRNNICYDLTEHHLAGLRRYFRLAADLGLIAPVEELAFLPRA